MLNRWQLNRFDGICHSPDETGVGDPPAKAPPVEPVESPSGNGPTSDETTLPVESKTTEEDGDSLIKEPEKEPIVEPLTADSIKMPEGMEILDGQRDEFLNILNNSELDGTGRAQALIDLQATVMKEAAEKLSETLQQQHDDWRTETEKDPEVGGNTLEENLGSVNKVLIQALPDKAERDEFLGLLHSSGLGNHRLMVKALLNVGKITLEGGGHLGTVPIGDQSQADILFPNQGS